jgi:hypothetical protein
MKVKIRRIGIRGQYRQKFMRLHLNQWLGMVVYSCPSSCARKQK